jgi:hypothetical protein
MNAGDGVFMASRIGAEERKAVVTHFDEYFFGRRVVLRKN